MALPRKCAKCKCYIAPQLTRCPRCGTAAPTMKVAPTGEDRAAARAVEDSKVTTIHAKKIRWIPSQRSVDAHKLTLDDLRRQRERADTKVRRNALLSEIRAAKAMVTRGEQRTGTWCIEFFRTKHAAVPVIVSPKGNRYVSAPSDGKAELIIINRKGSAFKTTRLQRFETSRYARYIKDEAKEATVQKKRKAAKKQKRQGVTRRAHPSRTRAS